MAEEYNPCYALATDDQHTVEYVSPYKNKSLHDDFTDDDWSGYSVIIL